MRPLFVLLLLATSSFVASFINCNCNNFGNPEIPCIQNRCQGAYCFIYKSVRIRDGTQMEVGQSCNNNEIQMRNASCVNMQEMEFNKTVCHCFTEMCNSDTLFRDSVPRKNYYTSFILCGFVWLIK
ncbi:hypothetical protein L596_013379 [Steinernema carpocapsae]|uniref:Activin types I and II receptor domain-containing protein n=1 Tax=Steinernema carpocapsae TaxID=34508 RepID=A0A4U5P0U0_STECR|nr:hypothetical protein L596_013379 [Steinernema carpocapsae]